MPTLYLFPGAHKTGTSLLQAALDICRPEFVSQGYAIADRSKFYGSGLRNDLKAMEKNLPEVADLQDEFMRICNVEDIDRDFILSIENIFGEFSSTPYGRGGRVIKNLKRILPDHRINCVFYLRRQDGYFESSYVQAVHKGRDVDFAEFYEENRHNNLNWTKVIQPLRRNLEGHVLDVRAFETIRGGLRPFIREFFDTFERIDAKLMTQRSMRRLKNTNLSLSTKGIEVARAAFKALPERIERERVARLLQTLFSNANQERFRLPPDTRMEIANRFADDNALLIKLMKMKPALAKQYRFEDLGLGQAAAKDRG